MKPLWYYAHPERPLKHGPVTEDALKDLVLGGQINPEYLVWREGMTDWVRMADVPELAVAMQARPSVSLPVPLQTVKSLYRWMGFVGVAQIILGVFGILSCVGLILGLLLLASGLALLAARAALEPAPDQTRNWVEFTSKLKNYFLMTGLAYIFLFLTAILIAMLVGAVGSLMKIAASSVS